MYNYGTKALLKHHTGDKNKALQYADMIPPAEDLYVHVLDGSQLAEHCQNYFWKVCDHMYLYMKYLLDCSDSGYTCEEKHAMWNTLYEIFHMIFPNQDFGFWDDRLARISFFMALESSKAGHPEDAIKELGQMTAHMESYRNFTEISHSSPLVNRLKINRTNIARSSEETLGQTYLRYINTHKDSIFMSVKEDCRFIDITERLAAL